MTAPEQSGSHPGAQQQRASAWDVECYRDAEWIPFFEVTFRTQERAERTMRAVTMPTYPMRVVPLHRPTEPSAPAVEGTVTMEERERIAELLVGHAAGVYSLGPDTLLRAARILRGRGEGSETV